MTELLNVGKLGLVQNVELKEGDVTVVEKTTSLGRIDTYDFDNEAHVDDLLKIVGDNQFEPCTNDNDVPLALVLSEPDFPTGGPSKDATYGDYENRRCSALILCRKIKTVKLAADNSKINPGDKIKLASAKDKTFDKGTSSDNNMAITGADANAGGLITVAFDLNLL